MLSQVQFFATSVSRQAPQSMEFSRQDYCSGLPFPIPGNLPDPGIEPAFLASPELAEDSLPLVPPGKPCPKIRLGNVLINIWGQYSDK